MEGRNHSSAGFVAPGVMPRMKKDLLRYSHDLLQSFQPRPPIRRAGASPQKLHVGVIGAGLAGLRCAELLIDGGAKVTILEARDRIGGRIHQSRLLHHAVDTGPNWIHGTDNNPIFSLAKSSGTSLCAVADTTHVFGTSGDIIPKDLADTGLDTVWSLIEEAFKYSNSDCANINPERSLKDFFGQQLAEGKLTQDEQARVLLLAEMWGSFIGDSWERQSLKWFWLEECLDGENLYVMENHNNILQGVAAKSIAQAEIHLSAVVSSVDSTSSESQDTRVVVKTLDDVFEFDEVVVAVPLGCLKTGKPSFVPPLPECIQMAIKNASYSSLEKVYLTFPVAFWDENIAANGGQQPYSTPYLEESQVNREVDGSFPSFIHFLNPEYVPADQKHWPIEMVPLSSPAVFGSHAMPTLLIYTYDPCAEYVLSLIQGLAPDSAEYFDVLDRFFQPYYSRLPNYKTGHENCVPSTILATNWHGDEFAGNGSYTNFQVSESTFNPATETQDDTRADESKEDQQIHLDLDVQAMRAGMPERGIWFAGEHTAPFVALGTTTGAYWSGEAAALRVLAANGLATGVTAPCNEAAS
ncbi:flavin containing amine oxidase [Colletotrichum scovillei]|uniref:Flavin containing amine oxidase n=1 Tax=Colletotrichum scovillei TaxID=1209932 RepID=A0A9P7RGR5_9PEZI|nr:flavin containing amine oxidase [Colletotrichum scovillei]KAG7075340.1 flavin containing amine oxidase [Colletotrichum scovillei]KAG7082325.1 flavin containing amine oxidase [Colletotrichum scovillei]